MFYVYMDSYYGKELIGKSEDRATAEKIKLDEEAKHQPGDLWSVRISDEEEKEFTCFD